MRIPAEASYEVVYSISTHPFLGPLIEGYVVQLTSQGNLSLLNQRIHIINADYYDKKLDENDYEALRLLDECEPEYLVKRFSAVKKIRPKEFFSKHYSQDLHKKTIRPHIERRLSKAMKLLYGKKFYVKELKNVIYQELSWSKHAATVLFHLRRNDTNTHYFATVKQNNQRIHIARNNSLLLTEQPCYLISGNSIVHFEDSFDGQKIKPFLNKSFIEIPTKSEEQYFSKFMVPLLEEYPVYAVGLEIVTEKYVASPILKLNQLMNGTIGLVLMFQYGNQVFPYDSGKGVSVHLEKTTNSYKFIRIKRSFQWETIKKETLLSMGLESLGGAEFGKQPGAADNWAIAWVIENLEGLRKAGFQIRQQLKQEFLLEQGLLSYEVQQDLDWFDVKATIRFGNFDIPFSLVRRQILAGNLTIQLPNGSLALIPEKWISQVRGLSEFSLNEESIRLQKQHMGLLASLGKGQTQFDISDLITDFKGVEAVAVPKKFKGKLRAYQKSGFDWLVFLRKHTFGGCLADDMGLGKTVQTLALLQHIKEHPAIQSNDTVSKGQLDIFNQSKSKSTSLLVVPTSLIHNWIYEAKNFTPDLLIHVHVGMHRAKNNDKFAYYDLVLTTYGTLRNDLSIFQSFQFECIILDESQFIKNPLSKLAKAVYQLRGNLRLTLTGTPVENTIVDLWSQMNFSNPGLLGTYKWFIKNYVAPIEKEFDLEKTERLHTVIKPFLMRRTKMQVASDLPPKTEQIIYCDMTDDQEDIYEKTKSTYRNIIMDSIQKTGMGKSRIQILSGLTKLRQMANHPLLDNPEYTGTSGKYEQVQQMLMTALEEGHKVLMFSQFVGHLGIYRNWLDQEKIEYAYLDGSTSAKGRQEQVKKFQTENLPLFLISLKAGGFGLNLTAADYVFMLDPWWNPASEAQAIDRTHRIGQVRNVFSYRFVTNNTVEQKIIKLQEKKRLLSESLVKSEETYLKKIDLSDLQEIFE